MAPKWRDESGTHPGCRDGHDWQCAPMKYTPLEWGELPFEVRPPAPMPHRIEVAMGLNKKAKEESGPGAAQYHLAELPSENPKEQVHSSNPRSNAPIPKSSAESGV